MRPGMVFVGLALLLAAEYQGLVDALPLAIIFAVQFATVSVLLAVALWWRGRQARSAGQPKDDQPQDG